MYDEINSFVSYVKDAAEGGSSKEMAFVLVGEPGNGKTFFVEFLCRQLPPVPFPGRKPQVHLPVPQPGPARNLRQDHDHRVPDLRGPHDPGHEPLRPDPDDNKAFLAKSIGFTDKELEALYENYRPLGACSGYIWNDIRTHCGERSGRDARTSSRSSRCP